MCDIELLCENMNGEACLIDKVDELKTKIKSLENLKREVNQSVYETIASQIEKASKLELVSELEELKTRIENLSEEESKFSFFDLILSVLSFIPATAISAMTLKLVKIGFKKIYMFNLIKKGTEKIKPVLKKITKEADSFFKDVAIVTNLPSLYDATISEFKKMKKEDLQEGAINEVLSFGKDFIFNKGSKKSEPSSINLEEKIIKNDDIKITIGRYKTYLNLNLISNTVIEVLALNRLKNTYLISDDTEELICFIQNEIDEIDYFLNSKEAFLEFFEIHMLTQMITKFYPKDSFFDPNVATLTPETYENYTEIREYPSTYQTYEITPYIDRGQGNSSGGERIYKNDNLLVLESELNLKILNPKSKVHIILLNYLKERYEPIKERMGLDFEKYLLHWYEHSIK